MVVRVRSLRRGILLLPKGSPEGGKGKCMDMVRQQKEEQGAQAWEDALQEQKRTDTAVGCCVAVFPLKRYNEGTCLPSLTA